MSSEVPNIFIDSDGVIADFDKALIESGLTADNFKHVEGAYLFLDVMPHATEALSKLRFLEESGLIKVWILTKTPTFCPHSYTEKILWYRKHFPWLENRVILSQDKSLLGDHNDFLIDDRPHKGNVHLFKGTFWLFDAKNIETCWDGFIKTILDRAKAVKNPNIPIINGVLTDRRKKVK
jgi:5'(3')-deoxyribonucleotidase